MKKGSISYHIDDSGGGVNVYPVVLAVVNSLRYGGSAFTLRQYGEFFFTNHTAMLYFWNSALYAGAITAVSIIVSFPLGFLFAGAFPRAGRIVFVYLL